MNNGQTGATRRDGTKKPQVIQEKPDISLTRCELSDKEPEKIRHSPSGSLVTKRDDVTEPGVTVFAT
jgi:hypothetical protein